MTPRNNYCDEPVGPENTGLKESIKTDATVSAKVKADLDTSIYTGFDREAWRGLALKTPLPLTSQDVANLRALGDPIDIAEADAVYRPLCALIQAQVQNYWSLAKQREDFLGVKLDRRIPFIIGIAGSVAVGKSTTARLLQHLLSRGPATPRVDLVTTDGFLYPNAELERRGLMARKGFPESYDRARLRAFLGAVKAGQSRVKAPVYSHLTYDVLPGEYTLVDSPDILIVEGINVLQPPVRRRSAVSSLEHSAELWQQDVSGAGPSVAISDFFDFSIYVDAQTADIERWYVERFLRLKQTAFSNPDSYFQVYAGLDDRVAEQIALDIWNSVNLPNLEQQILPTRGRATLIICKGHDHLVKRIWLRKI